MIHHIWERSYFHAMEAAEAHAKSFGCTLYKSRTTYRDYILFRPGYKYALVYRIIQYSLGNVKLFLLRSE